MPVFDLTTNVAKEAVPANFGPQLSKLISECTGKPEKWVSIKINAGATLYFGGLDSPCAICRLLSIGGINRKKNKENSAKIMKFLTTELGIPDSRVYIEFSDAESENVGWSSSTFACM